MYLALYRKYRPKTFDDVISQEHITTTLKNQITNSTTAHAYLFTGSRGTGKTTCAKILAMAVNCLNPKDGNPCLECASCREIQSGAATDIVEMDAASNNGVEDVRQLRDEVAYTPVSCKYRVYIIDEVHMLSVAAFNALLKTLEEPPEHVKFILATTELHKVPATILSRCQRFEFRRIDIRDSAERLLSVAQKEGVTLDNDAAKLISRLSDGGMRDALSVLDRCISADPHITADVVRECAGVADNRHLFMFSEMTAVKDVSGCIRLLNELHKGSKDIARIIDELSGHYRDLMLYKTVPADKELLSAMPDEYPELERISNMYSLDDILRCLSLLQQCADNIGKTKQRKTLAEMCFVKMCLGLGVQSEASPRTAFSAPPASAGSAGVSSQSNVSISVVPVETAKEEFKPTPLEDMSPQNAATVAKLRALNEETARIIKESRISRTAAPAAKTASAKAKAAPAAETIAAKAEPAPPPVMNSVPAVPDIFDAPPPEEPPMEFVPQREFEPDAPVKLTAEKPLQKADAQDNTPSEKPPAPEKEQNAEKEPPRKLLDKITPEQWQEAIDKTYPMTRTMLAGSSVETKGDTLIIHSSNFMLVKGMKDSDLKSLENEISEAIGTQVHIRIAAQEKETAAEAAATAVNQLLEKAKQLNIEVSYK